MDFGRTSASPADSSIPWGAKSAIRHGILRCGATVVDGELSPFPRSEVGAATHYDGWSDMRVSFDVLVAGGGMAGVCAAIAAARAGARTILLERHGFLGGAATAGAVVQFMGWKTEGGTQIVGGLAQEIIDRTIAAGGSDGHGWFTMSTGLRMDRVEFDPEVLKTVLDEMVITAGVQPLFHSWVSGVGVSGRSVAEVRALTKSGELAFVPRVVVDCSGDLDLLHAAGCEMLALGQGEELQPATLVFRMGPIDFDVFNKLTSEQKADLSRRGVVQHGLGRLALHCNQVPDTRDGWFNVTRIAVDGTDAFALSRAEIEGRRQAVAAARFIAESVPGCERARLNGFASQIGIRETRRVRGRVVLEEGDLRSGRVFPDTVALSAFPIDLHQANGKLTRLERLGGKDHYYCIPLGALIPASLDNALVAGRGLSATHTALAAVRVMPPAMAMGQAAGIAAAHAARSGEPVANVPFEIVRRNLLEAGAVLPDLEAEVERSAGN